MIETPDSRHEVVVPDRPFIPNIDRYENRIAGGRVISFLPAGKRYSIDSGITLSAGSALAAFDAEYKRQGPYHGGVLCWSQMPKLTAISFCGEIKYRMSTRFTLA